MARTAGSATSHGGLHRRKRHPSGARGAGLAITNTQPSQYVAVADATYVKNWPAARPKHAHQRMVPKRVTDSKRTDWFLKQPLSTPKAKQERRAARLAQRAA